MVLNSSNKTFTGFRSFIYRSGYVYNFVNQRGFEFKRKFKTIATIVNRSNTKKVMDLPCGTGYLTRYLNPNIHYIGFDLNKKFLSKIRKDWHRGFVKSRKITLRQVNIFNFDEYPNDVDTIVFCDILHHINPRHKELVENAKRFAEKIIICEPISVKPSEIQGQDWISKMTLYLVKLLPEKMMKYIDFFLADNDGVNSYKDRSQWRLDKESLKELYKSFGIINKRIYCLDDEIIGVWEK